MTDPKPIRVFLGTMCLSEDGREQHAAVYTLSDIDDGYVANPSLKACGKVRLRPEMTFIGENVKHHGVLLVPEDRSEAILAGCSMQKDKLPPEHVTAQRAQYEKGRAALLKLQR